MSATSVRLWRWSYTQFDTGGWATAATLIFDGEMVVRIEKVGEVFEWSTLIAPMFAATGGTKGTAPTLAAASNAALRHVEAVQDGLRHHAKARQ